MKGRMRGGKKGNDQKDSRLYIASRPVSCMRVNVSVYVCVCARAHTRDSGNSAVNLLSLCASVVTELRVATRREIISLVSRSSSPSLLSSRGLSRIEREKRDLSLTKRQRRRFPSRLERS